MAQGTHSLRSTRQLARLGLLTAVGLALALLERQLPPPAPVPGVRWGLANAATLAALALGGPGAGFAVWAVRFFLVQAFGGGLFGPAFFVGGAGGLMAWGAMAALSRVRSLGVAGVSAAGAVAHHVGQIAAAAVVTATPGVMFLLPPLLLLGPPVGLLTGVLVALLLRRLRAAGVLADGGAPVVRRTGAASAGPAGGTTWAASPRIVRAADLLPAAGAVVLALCLTFGRTWWTSAGGQATHAVVTVAGSTWRTVDLSQDASYPLQASGGHMVVEVAGGAVRVRASDCPDQVCVLTGWISTPGDMVVCVPYRVVIQVIGGDGGGPDAILR